MAPAALVLVLLAACLHAGWNWRLHETPDRLAAVTVANLVAGMTLLPATLVAPPWPALPLILLSAVAEVAYALCLIATYQRGALALAYPLARGTAPLLVTLGGWALLAEPPSLLAVAGALALGAGLAVSARVGQRGGQAAAVGFALLTGVAIATYSLIDARAVRQVAPLGYLGVVLALTGMMLFASMRADWCRLQRALKPGTQIAVGSVAAYLLVLFAFQQARAGSVATLREVSVLFGVLLSRERGQWPLWVGAGLVVAGAVLTAL
jgi:drug/metabolite transporter (DMT)-like permease